MAPPGPVVGCCANPCIVAKSGSAAWGMAALLGAANACWAEEDVAASDPVDHSKQSSGLLGQTQSWDFRPQCHQHSPESLSACMPTLHVKLSHHM